MVKAAEIRTDDSGLILDYPYDKGQVEETKRIPGARWDRVQRVWRVPMTSIAEVRAFAERHGFNLSNELLSYESPTPRVPASGITRLNEGWSVSFPYDPVAIQAFKNEVPGAKWDSAKKFWKVPLASSPHLLGWAVWMKRAVPDELRDVADELTLEFDRLKSMSISMSGTLEIETATPLKHYQVAGVEYVTQARRCFIGDEMGTGKTAQSLAALEHNATFPAVIICPPSLTLNWAAEVEKFIPHRSVQILRSRTPYELEATDLTIVPWSVLHDWEPKLKGFQAAIFDESQYAKNKSKRTTAAKKLGKRIPKSGLVVLLTGTPIDNRPAELITQLEIMGRLNDFGGTTAFKDRYCGAFVDKFGHVNFSGATNTIELHERLRGTCFIRRTKAQVMSELPEVVMTKFIVEGDSKAMKVYSEAEANIVAYLIERAELLALEMGTNPRSAAVRARMAAEKAEELVKLMTLRRLAALAKLPAVHEWMESRVEGGHKVILAAHHRDVVDALADRWGGLKIQGGMKPEDVEEAKRKFQEYPVDVAPAIVLSVQAGKTGHTLTAAQDVGMVEMPWTPGEVDQVIARAHRLGQKGSVEATFFVAQNTVDEKVYDLVAGKRSVVDAVTDGKDTGGPAVSVTQEVIRSLLG